MGVHEDFEQLAQSWADLKYEMYKVMHRWTQVVHNFMHKLHRNVDKVDIKH